MKEKSMGLQPENLDNRLGIFAGLIGGLWQYRLNINLPADFWAKIGEPVITACLCGFAGMAGKQLFVVTRRAIVAYFKSRKK